MADDKPRILVIDDEIFYIHVLVNVLEDDYHVSVAKDGEQGLKLAQGNQPPDLILLDIMMPGMDGYDVCEKLKSNDLTADIPVIFLTVKSEIDDEVRGFEIGAVDYIVKPISPPLVHSRVKNHLMLAEAKNNLRDQNELLEQRVEERTREISRTQDVAILCMASLAETRDSETGNHIRRTQHYIRLLSEHLRHHPEFRQYLNGRTIRLLYKSAPLHDIGKVGVPDRILLKPGKLEGEDWEEMKRHTTYGYEALLRAEENIGCSTFLNIAREIALTHHERWDGSGYPSGLKGSDIPISGRLMALADVYDALITKRVYKEAFLHADAVKMIIDERGMHFDPDIVDAFESLQDEFQRIATEFAD